VSGTVVRVGIHRERRRERHERLARPPRRDAHRRGPGRGAVRIGLPLALLGLVGPAVHLLSAPATVRTGVALQGAVLHVGGAPAAQSVAAVPVVAARDAGLDLVVAAVSGARSSTATAVAARTSARTPAPPSAVDGVPVAWHSGASGTSAVDGSLGRWRGEPLQILQTWDDTSAQVQRDLPSLAAFSRWNGDLDVAVGALAPGETWARAARGAYTARWTHAVRVLRTARAGRPGAVYVRFAHEMTGDWFTWKVGSGNVTAFRTSWRLFAGILRREFPQARLVFSPNDGNHSDVTVDRIWPGDDVVDVVAPDSYDGWPDRTGPASWDGWVDSTDRGPRGLGAWLRFAAAHGKPFAVAEWGLHTGDHPYYVTRMHDFLAACAPRIGDTDLAGRCVYDVYFNVPHLGDRRFLVFGGPNPRSAQAYRGLVWGSR